MSRLNAIKHWRFLNGPATVCGIRFGSPNAIFGKIRRPSEDQITADKTKSDEELNNRYTIDTHLGDWYKHEEVVLFEYKGEKVDVDNKHWFWQKFEVFALAFQKKI